MNTLDDLRSSLDAYADRGDERGADEVWAAASDDDLVRPQDGSPGSRRALLVAVAAALVLVVGTVVVTRADGPTDVVTAPDPDGTDGAAVPIVPKPIVIPDGRVAHVDAAHGRIWVTNTLDVLAAESRVRSFDPETGRQLSEATLPGRFVGAASTDQAYWVRTDEDRWDLVDPVTGAAFSGHLTRIDPATGEATPRLELLGAGALSARGPRLAMSDAGRLQVYDEDDDSLVSTPLAEAMGPGYAAGASPSAPAVNTFGYADLAFGPTGLYGLDQMTGLFIEMDPTSGRYRTSQPIEFGGLLYPHLAASPDRLWFSGEQMLMGRPLPLSTEADGPEPTITVIHDVVDLVPWADGAIVAVTRAGAFAVRDGTGSPSSFTYTRLDPDRESSGLEISGRPWIAQWPLDQSGAATTIDFVAVATGDDATTTSPSPGPVPTAPPTTSTPASLPAGGPPAVLTVGSTEPLADGQVVSIGALGLPGGIDVTLRVCLVDDSGTIPCRHSVESDPLPVERVPVMAAFGELMTEWVAQRSIYDGRWHDCAVEACELRIYEVDAAGVADTSAALAQTPVTFSTDSPVLRPTLTVTPDGPIRLGATVSVVLTRAEPGARGLDIGLCRTGRHDGSCRFVNGSMERTADRNGDISVSFLVERLDGALPGIDPASAPPSVDCTSAPGTCSFSIFPSEGSSEPYATVPVDIVG